MVGVVGSSPIVPTNILDVVEYWYRSRQSVLRKNSIKSKIDNGSAVPASIFAFCALFFYLYIYLFFSPFFSFVSLLCTLIAVMVRIPVKTNHSFSFKTSQAFS